MTFTYNWLPSHYSEFDEKFQSLTYLLVNMGVHADSFPAKMGGWQYFIILYNLLKLPFKDPQIYL